VSLKNANNGMILQVCLSANYLTNNRMHGYQFADPTESQRYSELPSYLRTFVPSYELARYNLTSRPNGFLEFAALLRQPTPLKVFHNPRPNRGQRF